MRNSPIVGVLTDTLTAIRATGEDTHTPFKLLVSRLEAAKIEAERLQEELDRYRTLANLLAQKYDELLSYTKVALSSVVLSCAPAISAEIGH